MSVSEVGELWLSWRISSVGRHRRSDTSCQRYEIVLDKLLSILPSFSSTEVSMPGVIQDAVPRKPFCCYWWHRCDTLCCDWSLPHRGVHTEAEHTEGTGDHCQVPGTPHRGTAPLSVALSQGLSLSTQGLQAQGL